MKPKNASHHKRIGPVVVERELLQSPAYLALKGHAPQVLGLFLCKRQVARINKGKEQVWVCINNGELVFTYREAKEKYGLQYTTFSRALDELMAKGFLRISTRESSSWEEPAMYELLDEWRKYGTPDFSPSVRIKQCTHRFPKGHPLYLHLPGLRPPALAGQL